MILLSRREFISGSEADAHPQSPMGETIVAYNLHMRVERYQSEESFSDADRKYIRD